MDNTPDNDKPDKETHSTIEAACGSISDNEILSESLPTNFKGLASGDISQQPRNILMLQRLIGNQATLNLINRKETKPISAQPFAGLKMVIQRKPPNSVEEAMAISKNASKTFPTTKPKQSSDVFSSLRREAMEGFDELKTVADQIASSTGGTASHRNKLKGFDRSWDKIVKKYGSDASGLIDTIGSKIVYQDFKGIYGAIDILINSSPVEVVYFQDRFLTPVASGYSDIIMSVRLSNGHIAELRLHLASVDAIFEKEHRLYEKIRKDGKQSLTPEELKEYEQLQSEYNEARTEAFSSLG